MFLLVLHHLHHHVVQGAEHRPRVRQVDGHLEEQVEQIADIEYDLEGVWGDESASHWPVISAVLPRQLVHPGLDSSVIDRRL